MKKIFTLTLGIISLFAINAQITIDGTMTDWDNVPILSEPGVFPYVKVMNDGSNMNFMMNLGSEAFHATEANILDYRLDADKNVSTGTTVWQVNLFAYDYYTSGTSMFAGSTWSGNILREKSSDLHAVEASYPLSYLTGTSVNPESTIAFQYYLTADHTTAKVFPDVDWNFDFRNGFTVKPRSEITLSTSAEFLSSNAYYHPFMKDENINAYLDFQSAKYNTQNPLHWASWLLNVVTPGQYTFKMTFESADGGKIQLALVDLATNTVVKTIPEIWYAKHDAGMTEQTFSSTVDLSDVSVGKYMLKVTNPTTWGANLKIQKITFTNTATSTRNIDFGKTVKVVQNNGLLSVTSAHTADFKLFTTNGQLIYSANRIQSFEKELNAGVYLMTVDMDGQKETRKVVISK